MTLVIMLSSIKTYNLKTRKFSLSGVFFNDSLLFYQLNSKSYDYTNTNIKKAGFKMIKGASKLGLTGKKKKKKRNLVCLLTYLWITVLNIVWYERFETSSKWKYHL